MNHQKNSYEESRLCVGRRKETMLGYVPKNDEKNSSGSEGLNQDPFPANHFFISFPSAEIIRLITYGCILLSLTN